MAKWFYCGRGNRKLETGKMIVFMRVKKLLVRELLELTRIFLENKFLWRGLIYKPGAGSEKSFLKIYERI